jgi:hypothetical protein
MESSTETIEKNIINDDRDQTKLKTNNKRKQGEIFKDLFSLLFFILIEIRILSIESFLFILWKYNLYEKDSYYYYIF